MFIPHYIMPLMMKTVESYNFWCWKEPNLVKGTKFSCWNEPNFSRITALQSASTCRNEAISKIILSQEIPSTSSTTLTIANVIQQNAINTARHKVINLSETPESSQLFILHSGKREAGAIFSCCEIPDTKKPFVRQWDTKLVQSNWITKQFANRIAFNLQWIFIVSTKLTHRWCSLTAMKQIW